MVPRGRLSWLPSHSARKTFTVSRQISVNVAQWTTTVEAPTPEVLVVAVLLPVTWSTCFHAAEERRPSSSRPEVYNAERCCCCCKFKTPAPRLHQLLPCSRAVLKWRSARLVNSKVYGHSSSQCDIATPLREFTCHTGSHSGTCHPTEVTYPPLSQLKVVLDLATPEGCKAELT